MVCASDLGRDAATERNQPGSRSWRCRTFCEILDHVRLVDTIVWWQERCWRGIDTAAARDDLVMAGLRDRGAVAEVRAAHAWTVRHRTELITALRDAT